MPGFEDLILSLTARITHEQDFAYPNQHGELANRLRAKFAEILDPESFLPRVAIDDDQDIVLRIRGGSSWYITANSVMVVGWLTTPRELGDQLEIKNLLATMEALRQEREHLNPSSYYVRLLSHLRTAPRQDALSHLRSVYCNVALQPILGNIFVDKLQSFRTYSQFLEREIFTDNVELEGSLREIQLRYSREANAAHFPSFAEFLQGANLTAITANLRPFLESLTSNPNMLLGRVFKH